MGDFIFFGSLLCIPSLKGLHLIRICPNNYVITNSHNHKVMTIDIQRTITSNAFPVVTSVSNVHNLVDS
jgi:hypothetical protein